jgi:Arc/MetJ family transcription regulator
MTDEKTEMVQEQQVEKTEEVAAEVVSISKTDYEKMASALKEANKEAATRRKQLEALEAEKKSREEAELSELEKTAKRLQETEAQLKTLSRREMQRQAAEKVGLPVAFVSRLQGETLEELEADAESMLAALPKPEKPQPGLHPTNPPEGTQSETIAQKKARLLGEQVNPFTGGGVQWMQKPPTGE